MSDDKDIRRSIPLQIFRFLTLNLTTAGNTYIWMRSWYEARLRGSVTGIGALYLS
jgi:hypothetical protein